MKRIKIISGILALISAMIVGCHKDELTEKIPYSEIPDLVFRNYLLVHFDTNMDGFINRQEAMAVKEIDLRGIGDVKSLQGIEYFTSLEKLYIPGFIWLETLDLSHHLMLEVLDCSYIYGMSPDGYQNGLTLNISKNVKLKELYCTHSHLNNLDLQNNIALEILDCRNSIFETLDLSNNKRLRIINCSHTTSKVIINEFQYLEEF
jgi:hypothetical protein